MGKKKNSRISISNPARAILESISDGVFTVNPEWRITSFNRAAEEITGIDREEAIGSQCWEVFRSSMCESECALRKTLQTGKPVVSRTGYIINAEGRKIPVSVSTAVLKNPDGEIIGGAETFRDLSEVESLRSELKGRYRIGDLISRNNRMQEIFEILPAIAGSPATVLILGETGTGKEVIARIIHSLSPRSEGPFIAVNCGALPETLLESELFGYKKGAFTGANRDKPGLFQRASGGSIFLDEIAEMSPALQVKLLHVLQEKSFTPLGATRSMKSDVRIIVATNKDLSDMMKKGTFREDLYYRINVVRIELPPLRERREDIPLLVEQFIDRFNRLHLKSIQGITPEALSMLMAYDWPGNIRELENAIERSFILCNEEMIEAQHLPDELTKRTKITPSVEDMKSARDLLETQVIINALEKNNFNRIAAARDLGIHKSTLFRKIKRLGIKLPEKDGRSR